MVNNSAESTIYHGAGSRIRTDDLLITNQLLYQLSYAGIYEGKASILTHCSRPLYPLFCIPQLKSGCNLSGFLPLPVDYCPRSRASRKLIKA